MKRSRQSSVIPAIMLASALYAYWNAVKYALAVFALIFAIKRTGRLIYKTVAWVRSRKLSSVDTMNGISFEHYVAQILIDHGYMNVSLTEQYDYGVDIIAEKDGVRWGIQAKRYSGLVKAAAVRQVVTGLRLYNCDRGMVITNSTFSTVARHLADGNDCMLIDRAGLCALAR
ncbi:restriction endonuclease [Patescibacteria group bacterium]|nr:MAG: restriction endonuclease [Patescibacteria group bacterium]